MKKQNKQSSLIYNILVGIIIFLVPTNLFLKFLENEAYVNGLRVDYLIPKLYLSDIFILTLLLVWTVKFILQSINYFNIQPKNWLTQIAALLLKIKTAFLQKFWLSILLIIFFRQQFLSNYPFSSISYLLKIIELGFFSLFLIKNKKQINKKLIENAVLVTIFFQSSVALYQYINQKSLFGYLFLGEPNLSNYINITKSSLFGIEKILPYGTTAHPNILGGFLAIYLLYLFKILLNKVQLKTSMKSKTFIQSKASIQFKLKNNCKTTNKNLVIFLAISLAVVVLFLTQSISAIVTFLMGLSFIFCQKYLFLIKNKQFPKLTLKKILILGISLLSVSLLLINTFAKEYPNNLSLNRRNYLNIAAINMSTHNILTGVGLNNFTTEVESFSPNKEVVRFVQPAHNIFLLLFAETGLLGLAIIGLFIHYYKEKILKYDLLWTIILLPISLLDHYLITLNTGLLLIVFSTTLFSKKSNRLIKSPYQQIN